MQEYVSIIFPDAIIKSPSASTFSLGSADTVIDYMMYDKRLHDIVGDQLVNKETLLNPHYPVYVNLNVWDHMQKVKALRRPPKVPVDKPVGPTPPPMDWDQHLEEAQKMVDLIYDNGKCVGEGSAAADMLEKALPQWYKTANEELADVLGVDVNMTKGLGRPVKIVDDFMSNVFAKNSKNKPLASRALQWLASKVTQTYGLIKRMIIQRRAIQPLAGKPITPQRIMYTAQGIIDMTYGRKFSELDKVHPLKVKAQEILLAATCWCQNAIINNIQDCNNLMDDLSSLSKDLHKEVGKVRAVEQQATEVSKQRFAERALHGDASGGFRFVKPQAPLRPKPIQSHDDENLTIAPMEILADKTKELSEAWRVNKKVCFVPEEQEEIPLMNVMTEEELTGASMTFKRGTARSDGWHPRHFGLLSSGAKKTLCLLMAIMEAVGNIPHSLRALQTHLIPQDIDGTTHKRRPIGLFRGQVRLWGRMRTPYVRKWEVKECNDQFFTNAAGKKVGDSCWRTAIKAKLATSDGQKALDYQGDIQGCFEHVDRAILWDKGKSAGYPLPILRFSLASYAWPRVIVLDGITSDYIKAKTGIVAGGSHATTELKLYVRDDMRAIVKKHKEVRVVLQVDDIIMSAVHASANILINMMYQAVKDIVIAFEHNLCMKFAPSRSCILSNDPVVANRARTSMGKHAGKVLKQIARLGITYSAGRRQKLKPQLERVRRALMRSRRIKFLAMASKKQASKLFFAGTMPAASFGIDTVGMGIMDVRRLTRAAADANHMNKAIKFNPLAWALMRHKGRVQPDILVSIAPTLRYAEEWWNATDNSLAGVELLNPKDLVNAHSQATEEMTNKKWTHSTFSCSPVALAIKGFEKAGLQMVDPVHFKDTNDNIFNITHLSPALLKPYLIDKMEQKMVDQYVEDQMKKLLTSEAQELSMEGLWTEPLIRALKTKGKGALTFRQKRYAMNFICNNIVTGLRLRDQGFMTDGRCPFCNRLDTVTHRVFTCEYLADDRKKIVPKWLASLFLKEGAHSLLFQRGWMKSPDGNITVKQPDQVQYLYEKDGKPVDGPLYFKHGDKVYGDGSGFRAIYRHLARAGYAVASFHSNGMPDIVIKATVPASMPQSAAAGERLAIHTTNVHAQDKAEVEYIGDCTGAFTIINGTKSNRATSFKSLWAGLAREIGLGWIATKLLRWVKSHQVETDDMSESDCNDIRYNSFVDAKAKEAAALFLPPKSEQDLHDRLYRNVMAVVQASAKMLELWPSTRELYGELQLHPKSHSGTKSGNIAHNFVWRGDLWQCTQCFRRKHKYVANAKVSFCKPVPSTILGLFENPNGHVLNLTTDHAGNHFAFCSRCFAHASVIPRALLGPCNGMSLGDKNAIYARSCFHGNPAKHPRKGVPLSDPIPAMAVLSDLNAVKNNTDIVCVGYAELEAQDTNTHLANFDDEDQSFVPGNFIESEDDM